MTCGDSVHGVGIVGDLDASVGQLVPESYRPGAGDRRRSFQRGEAFRQLLGTTDQRLPDPLVAIGVERGEHLATEAVKDGQSLTSGPLLGADSAGDGVEGADPDRRQARRGAQPAGRGDPDPQAGEGTGAEADGKQIDVPPAAGRRRRPLYLFEQAGRVPGLPLRGEPEL
jgi:hypothetical protein